METKTITATASKNHHYFDLIINETFVGESQTNYSTISYTFRIRPKASGYDWYNFGNKIKFTVNINGNEVNGTIPAYNGTSTVTLASGTYDIPHDADGSKTMAISFIVNDTTSQTITCGNASASDTMALTTIQRESVIRGIGTAMTDTGTPTISVVPVITQYIPTAYQELVLYPWNRSSTTSLSFNGVTSGNVYSSTDTTYLNKLYENMGTNTSITILVVLNTYTDSTKTVLIGNHSVETYVTLPTYTITLANPTVSDTETNYDTYKTNVTDLIRYISKPQITFSATSSTGHTYGRTITYTDSLGSNITSPYTLSLLTTNNYSITASDGRVAPSTKAISGIIDYAKPTISSAKITRTSPTSSTATLTVEGTYYDGNGLTNLETPVLTMVWSEGETSKPDITPTITEGTTTNHITSFTASYTLTGLDYRQNISYVLTLTDKINNETPGYSGVCTKGIPAFNVYEDSNDVSHFVVNGEVDINGTSLFINDNNGTPTEIGVILVDTW